MNTLNNNLYFYEDIYKHIIKGLVIKIFSDANFDMSIRKHINPRTQTTEEKVVDKDNIYIQSIIAILRQDLSYYLRNLIIIFEVISNTVTDFKYDYYDKSDSIEGTNITVKFV